MRREDFIWKVPDQLFKVIVEVVNIKATNKEFHIYLILHDAPNISIDHFWVK